MAFFLEHLLFTSSWEICPQHVQQKSPYILQREQGRIFKPITGREVRSQWCTLEPPFSEWVLNKCPDKISVGWAIKEEEERKHWLSWQTTRFMPGGVGKFPRLFSLLTVAFYNYSLAKEVRKVNLKSKNNQCPLVLHSICVLIPLGSHGLGGKEKLLGLWFVTLKSCFEIISGLWFYHLFKL